MLSRHDISALNPVIISPCFPVRSLICFKYGSACARSALLKVNLGLPIARAYPWYDHTCVDLRRSRGGIWARLQRRTCFVLDAR